MTQLAAELASIDLGDQRLNRRAQNVLTTLGEKPTASIPAACHGWHETKAVYRLFDHPDVTAKGRRCCACPRSTAEHWGKLWVMGWPYRGTWIFDNQQLAISVESNR